MQPIEGICVGDGTDSPPAACRILLQLHLPRLYHALSYSFLTTLDIGMASEKKSSVSDVGCWAMNVISSVGIILANKQVMSGSGYDFRFATTLTGFHFLVTALVGFISKSLGYSSSNKHVPVWDLFWFSVVANISIVGMNLSLMLNSVGFYQISKLSMIPVVCVMEWILHDKQYSEKVKAAVFVVIIGVGVCTVTDVKVNLKGFLAAAIAVFCTSLQQISIGSLQKKYNIGSFDLLSKTAPIQTASLLLLGPFVDYSLNGYNLLDYEFSVGAMSSSILQPKPIPLHWTLLSSFISGIGAYENSVCSCVSWAMESDKQAQPKTVSTIYIKDSEFPNEDEGLLKSGYEMQVTMDMECGLETKE
eukprot:Gb_37975 [translate_table: standard]